MTREYDERGREIRTAWFDERNQPVPADGAAAVEREFDDAGNVLVTRYFDTSGNIILFPAGYAWLEKEYNGIRQVVRETKRNADGSPFTRSDDGYVTARKEYDEKGNVTLEQYFDEDDDPETLPAGYAAIHMEYDDEHRVVRTDYLDKDGDPAALEEGFASVLLEYEDGGNTVTESWLDQKGKTFLFKGDDYAYAGIRRIYADPDHVIEMQYCDERGRITTGPDGFALQTYEYDDEGRQIGTAWFDTDLKAYTNKEGYAAVITSYAEDGTAADTYLDEKGREVDPE